MSLDAIITFTDQEITAMPRIILGRALLACLAVLAPLAAHAQSSPGLVYLQTPSAAQWNNYFTAKLDYVNPVIPGTLTVAGLATLAKTRVNSDIPIASTVSEAFRLDSNDYGTVSSGDARFVSFNFNNDSVNAASANGGGALGVYIGHNIVSGAAGGRTALSVFLNQAAATTAAAEQYYVAAGMFADVAFSAGGATGSGNARGNVFGGNASARIKAGAGLYWNSAIGFEADVGVATGTAVVYKAGMKVVQWSTDAVSGTTSDFGYGLGNQPAGSPSRWTIGFAIGDPQGWWPIKSTGTIMGTYAALTGGGPTMSAAHGIDFSAVTFSADAFKSTAFNVDGTGIVTGLKFVSTAMPTTCTSQPTGTLRNNAGVVNVC